MLNNTRIKNALAGSKQCDGRGLWFVKTKAAGKWIYRFTYLGRRREMGLGTFPTVTLAMARQARDEAARTLAQGQDPIQAREAERQAAKDELNRTDPTLEDLVNMAFEAKRAGLRGDGERGRWLSPLTLHVLPRIGRKRVSLLTALDVVDTLKPIWRTKHPTAEKAMQRLNIALKWGKLAGMPCDPEIAARAQHLLGEVRHVEQHIEATPWQEIPGVYARLLESPSMSAICVRWHVLTLVRSMGCRLAEKAEVSGAVWTVPAARIKGKEGAAKDFAVPLGPEAMAIIKDTLRWEGRYLFPGPTDRPISDVAVNKALTRAKTMGRVHGLRTSFRTWVQDTQPAEMENTAEMILGHRIYGATESAYARSDMLERRRGLMLAWEGHVTSERGAALRVVR